MAWAPMPPPRIMHLHLIAVSLLLAASRAASTEGSRESRSLLPPGSGLTFYPLDPPVLPLAYTDIQYFCNMNNSFLASAWVPGGFASRPTAVLMLMRITNATTGAGNSMIFVVDNAPQYTAQVISSEGVRPLTG